MKKYIIIAVRDFPDFPLGHRHSYIVGFEDEPGAANELANKEVVERGGKYGCIVFDILQESESFTVGRNDEIILK